VPENDYGDLLERWKVELIGVRARRLLFPEGEIPDLEQMIVPELLKADYAPVRQGAASERTFVITVIDHLLMRTKRDRARDRRRAAFEARSLDADPAIAEKVFLQLHHAEDIGMRLDFEQALMGLAPAERAICEALMEGQSQADIARALGCTRAAVCKQVSKLADRLRRLGLDAYLPPRGNRG